MLGGVGTVRERRFTAAGSWEGADTNIRSSIVTTAAVAGIAASACIFAAPLLAGSTTDPRSGWHVVARGHANIGGGNSSSLVAQVRRPHALAVRLSVQQGVTARVQWNLSCSKRSAGHGGRSETNGGRFGADSPIFKPLPLPITNPDRCDVIVNALAGANATIATDYSVDIRLDLLER